MDGCMLDTNLSVPTTSIHTSCLPLDALFRPTVNKSQLRQLSLPGHLSPSRRCSVAVQPKSATRARHLGQLLTVASGSLRYLFLPQLWKLTTVSTCISQADGPRTRRTDSLQGRQNLLRSSCSCPPFLR